MVRNPPRLYAQELRLGRHGKGHQIFQHKESGINGTNDAIHPAQSILQIEVAD